MSTESDICPGNIYVLVTFVHISNISGVTDQFWRNFLDPISWSLNFCGPEFFWNQKFFQTLNFFGAKFFWPVILLDPNFFWTKDFFRSKTFSVQIFFDQQFLVIKKKILNHKFYSAPKKFLTQNSFQNKFWSHNLFDFWPTIFLDTQKKMHAPSAQAGQLGLNLTNIQTHHKCCPLCLFLLMFLINGLVKSQNLLVKVFQVLW